MTIILFLVDSSASMNQRTYKGTTLLDVTKNAIEMFQKIRGKNPNSKWDRLMLLTFDEPPGNIKAGWKENHLQFSTQLKNLQASGLTEMGPALKSAFDMLNMNRNQSGIDTYGQGRCPFYIEPAIIICFTDGQPLVTSSGLQKQLTLPMLHGICGSELTKEPFRWDQRVFGIVLKIPSVGEPVEAQPDVQPQFIPSADSCSIDSMCEVTGGRSYCVTSPRQLAQSLESIAQKAAMHGVVVNFDYVDSPIPIDENTVRSRANSPAWKSTKRMILVQRSATRGHSVGHWPIPEAFWPDAKAKALPPRDAQPTVKFCSSSPAPTASLMNHLPYDQYELEPSPLTQYVLKHGRGNICYQTYISQSFKYGEHPFGFIIASGQRVMLNVMPYNYETVLTLLDELVSLQLKPTLKWKGEFENYLKTIPLYYAPYLRRALARMGVHNLIPESMDNNLGFQVVGHLKQVRIKAKQEHESLLLSVGKPMPTTECINVVNKSTSSLLARQDFNELVRFTGGDFSTIASMQKDLVEYEKFPIAVPKLNAGQIKTFNYKNPYDIARKDLLSQIARLRASLLQPSGLAGALLKEEHLHNVPVNMMGNYHEYLAKAPQPLRQLESQAERLHTFGNPFKVNKNLMIDEADEAMPGMALPGNASPKRNKRESSDILPNSPARKRRKPGPLPRHITLTNRPTTPPVRSLSPTDSISSNGEEPELVTIENSAQAEKLPGNGSVPHALQNGISPTQFKAQIVQQEENGNNGFNKNHNDRLQQSLLKFAKRPGQNFDELFSNLKHLQGSTQQKSETLHRVMLEAQRFKRYKLLTKLQDFESELTKNNNNTAVSPDDERSGVR